MNVVHAWSRRDRFLATAIVGVGSLVIATASGVVVAGASSTPDVFTGCLDHKTHTIYKVAANATRLPTCRSGDRRMTWNSRGPQGLRGLRGFTGAPGPSSLAALAGTPCTTTEGPAGTVAVTVDAENSIHLTCHSTAVVPFAFTDTAAQALANRVFARATSPTIAVAADCGSPEQWACPGGIPSNPLPTLTLDQSMHLNDSARATGTAPAASDRYDLTGKFRLSTVTAIPVTISGNQCNVSVDTTQGTVPDLTLTVPDQVDTGGHPNGPTSLGTDALTGLEAGDITIGGGFTCNASSITVGQVSAMLAATLRAWLLQVAVVCGATAPDYVQACPA